ncbi:hypothetical protein KKC94_04380 [Patescibacteria group bacterium]|nr:hypothetical protein [Patescibacteria group bacterium]
MKILWKIFWEETEFKRQIAHFAFGIFYAALFYVGLMDAKVSAILFLGSIAFSLFLKRRRKFVDKLVLLLERQKDLYEIPLKGLIFFLLGATLTISLFEFVPAMCGILVLAISDSIGTLYGKYLGVVKIRWNPDKHMEGPILGGLVAAVALAGFVPLPAALMGAYCGAFLDTLKLRIFGFTIDDNLLIPLVSAGVVSLMI